MQLKYQDEQYNIEDRKLVISTILEKVSELIKQDGIVFSHLIVDDVAVYENHEGYLTERLNEIEQVEIITREIKEMIWDSMISVQEYLERAIPALNKLVDSSYGSFTNETWEQINQLGGGMQWILEFYSFVKAASQQPSNWIEVEASIKVCEESFMRLIEGVEVQDTVLISDILSYEITPAYESLLESIILSLKDEVYLNDVN